jgi:dihydropyrimidinase
LLFDDEVYGDDRDILFNRVPPIRSAADQAELWRALEDGTLSFISTDDVPSSLAAKLRTGRAVPVEQIPGGSTQIETRLPTMFSATVPTGRLSLEDFVDRVSTQPARVFGLYPKKGVIAVGCDADLVLWDLAARWEMRNEVLHSDSDYTWYEGWQMMGKPLTTILRGKVIVEDDHYVGDPADGRFLRRNPRPGVQLTAQASVPA